MKNSNIKGKNQLLVQAKRIYLIKILFIYKYGSSDNKGTNTRKVLT